MLRIGIGFIVLALWAAPVLAHHVLGRPAYSLSEDSNTPPSMEVETQIGDYFVTFMAFPAFPRPNEPGRVNLYATRIDDGTPLQGEVSFTVRDDRWFAGDEETLGVQAADDNVYRQGFVFKEEGAYIVTARFQSGDEPYVIDFPLRIGDPSPVGPIGITVAVILSVLVGVSLVQRKRMQRLKLSSHQESVRGHSHTRRT
jgi:hypothetical protein